MSNISNKGIYTARAQLNWKGNLVKTVVIYRKEILSKQTKFIANQKAIDVLTTGDFNESIIAQSIESFLMQNGLFDMHRTIY